MKNFNLFLAIFLTLVSFLSISTTCFGQYSSQFQGAGSVGKGNAELTAFYSNVGAAYDGESEKVFNNFGFQSGIGISNLTEIRVKYDRFNYHEGDGEGVNTLMVGPKFSTNSGKFAFYLPFGCNFGEGWVLRPEGGLLYFVSDFDGNFYNFGLGFSKKLIKQN